ncbi:MAG: lipocalin family protein [Salinibacter sp.]|uniref:lipocalin family protein n=1 Tax=Salinibacter sp. TaxID=2065818 RepID=UPI0035D404DC
MPSTSFRPVLGALLLLCAGVLVVEGCDGSGSKQSSLYQRLTGTWKAERLEVGDFNYTSELRYTAIRFIFRDDDKNRTYRVIGERSDSTTVLSEGRVELRGDRLLRMIPGFKSPFGGSRPVIWTYRFEVSRAILRLPGNQRNGSRAFLSTLFPGRSWNGMRRVRLQLAPVEE